MEFERDAAEHALVANLRVRRADLVALLERHSDHWGFEDPIYRFYHHSFKVFWLQSQTESTVDLLRQVMPGHALNSWFTTIVAHGTGRTFKLSDNAN